jgi:crossover junction endodeoxyribonuclease RusA
VLTFFVPGRCAPQGSKRSVGRGRFVEASKYLPAWRKAITEFAIYAATEHSWDTEAGPVQLEVTFFLERPASISPSKRPYPIVPPDVDKLVRAIGDGLTDAGVWGDDSQVVELIARKRYSDGQSPGALITISRLDMSSDSHLMV